MILKENEMMSKEAYFRGECHQDTSLQAQSLSQKDTNGQAVMMQKKIDVKNRLLSGKLS